MESARAFRWPLRMDVSTWIFTLFGHRKQGRTEDVKARTEDFGVRETKKCLVGPGPGSDLMRRSEESELAKPPTHMTTP